MLSFGNEMDIELREYAEWFVLFKSRTEQVLSRLSAAPTSESIHSGLVEVEAENRKLR